MLSVIADIIIARIIMVVCLLCEFQSKTGTSLRVAIFQDLQKPAELILYS